MLGEVTDENARLRSDDENLSHHFHDLGRVAVKLGGGSAFLSLDREEAFRDDDDDDGVRYWRIPTGPPPGVKPHLEDLIRVEEGQQASTNSTGFHFWVSRTLGLISGNVRSE